jgi:hypothetical protein
MKKLVAINAAVLVLFGLIGLGAIELYLRFTVPASSGASIYHYTLDTKRYKVMQANAVVTAWGKELRTNELGFRDRGPSIQAKQPGEFRIVVLGDSFTVSAGVDFAEIYTTRLEQLLRLSHPQAKVINLAVGGYNPVQYAMVLEEVGLALQPDLLMVALFPDNDFSMFTYDQNRRVAMGEAPAVPPKAWYEHTYTWRAYGQRAIDKLQSLTAKPAGAAQNSEARRGWEENTAALKRIAHTARERDLPLAVAVLPHTWNFERQRELFGRVERLCRDQNLLCLNLLEPFIARRVPEASLRLNPLDSHPNEKYNAVVAEVLDGFLSPLLDAAINRGQTPITRTSN